MAEAPPSALCTLPAKSAQLEALMAATSGMLAFTPSICTAVERPQRARAERATASPKRTPERATCSKPSAALSFWALSPRSQRPAW